MLSRNVTWWLCRWLCKVNLGTIQMYIFSRNTWLLNRPMPCDNVCLKIQCLGYSTLFSITPNNVGTNSLCVRAYMRFTTHIIVKCIQFDISIPVFSFHYVSSLHIIALLVITCSFNVGIRQIAFLFIWSMQTQYRFFQCVMVTSYCRLNIAFSSASWWLHIADTISLFPVRHGDFILQTQYRFSQCVMVT